MLHIRVVLFLLFVDYSSDVSKAGMKAAGHGGICRLWLSTPFGIGIRRKCQV